MHNYLTCHSGWQGLHSLLALVVTLTNHLRPRPIKVEYRGSQLSVGGQLASLSGPETEADCAQEWRTLEISLAKEDVL